MNGGDIIETNVNGVVMDIIILDHRHSDTKDTTDTIMVENMELCFVYCGEIPYFVSSEEGGKDKGFVNY